MPLLGNIYYTRFATQIAMYGMAALSVDLLLGYAGLITFGQAAFFGVGAYAAGMLTVAGVHDALIVWPAAVLAAVAFALVIGALSLRTEGFQFIMVTLAFAQMVYYIGQSLRTYGGDNGFTMPRRNTLAGIEPRQPHGLLLRRAGAAGGGAVRRRRGWSIRVRHGDPRPARQRAPPRRDRLPAVSLQIRRLPHRRRRSPAWPAR